MPACTCFEDHRSDLDTAMVRPCGDLLYEKRLSALYLAGAIYCVRCPAICSRDGLTSDLADWSIGLLANEKQTTITPVPQIAFDSSEIHSATFDSWQIGNAEVAPLVFQSSIGGPKDILSGEGQAGVDASDFQGNFTNNPRLANVGVDFYSPPEFEGGLLVFGDKVALIVDSLVVKAAARCGCRDRSECAASRVPSTKRLYARVV